MMKRLIVLRRKRYVNQLSKVSGVSMKIPNLSDDEFKDLVTDKDVDDMFHEVFLIEDKQPIQIDIPMSDVRKALLSNEI